MNNRAGYNNPLRQNQGQLAPRGNNQGNGNNGNDNRNNRDNRNNNNQRPTNDNNNRSNDNNNRNVAPRGDSNNLTEERKLELKAKGILVKTGNRLERFTHSFFGQGGKQCAATLPIRACAVIRQTTVPATMHISLASTCCLNETKTR